MKKKLAILALCLVSILKIDGQTKQKELPKIDSLVFDWAKGNFSYRPWHVKEGTSISFIYTNINPFAVKSNVKSISIDTHYDQGESVFNSILRTESNDSISNMVKKDFNKGATEKIEKNPVQEIKNIQAKEDGQDSLSLVKITKSTYKDKNVNNYINLRNINKYIRLKEKENAKINREISSIKEKLSKVYDLKILDSMITIIMHNPSIRSSNELIKRVSSIAIDLKLVSDNREFMSQIHLQLDTFLTGVRRNINYINDRLSILDRINQRIKEIQSSDSEIIGIYSFDEYLKNQQDNLNNLSELFSGGNLTKIKNILISIQYKYDDIVNSSFRLYDKQILVLNKDFIEISDTLLSIDNNTTLKIIDPIRIKSTGGRRIDFSLGFALPFNVGFFNKSNSGINGRDYYLIKDDSNKVIGIGSSGRNKKFSFNPAGFVHYRFQTKYPVNFALTFAMNPDFNNLTTSKLMTGFSLAGVATNNFLNRIVLTGGIVAGYADCLKSKYEDLKVYSQINSLSDNDLIEKSIRLGGFVAISFNLISSSSSSQSKK